MKASPKGEKNVCKTPLFFACFKYIEMFTAKTPCLSSVLPTVEMRNSAGESSQYGGISSVRWCVL